MSPEVTVSGRAAGATHEIGEATGRPLFAARRGICQEDSGPTLRSFRELKSCESFLLDQVF
jgi:hypothetical protein